MELKISETLGLILNFARDEAMRTGSYGIAPDHLFLGILRHGDNQAVDALKALDVDTDELKKFIDSKIFTNEHIPFEDLEKISLSKGARNVLNITLLEATRMHIYEVEASHLLLALLRLDGSYGGIFLRELGIDYTRVFSYMDKTGVLKSRDRQEPVSGPHVSPEPQAEPAREKDKSEESPLEEFGCDMTLMAQNGELDPVVGRSDEISRVIQILGRRKKNSAMLVGDPGVGKSAIVEGIAQKIASGDIPPALRNKKIFSFDIASVVAGTRFRGDFEKRIKSIISQLKDDPDAILFIDEFHTVVGAGSASGSLDAANILKPALARGEIQCIGATTIDEFTKVIEKDGALDRRFQKVVINPVDAAGALEILHSVCSRYEEHHGVSYSAEALQACVTLTERYITDRCLPDKAIDALDEAGSMVSLGRKKKDVLTVVNSEDIATVVSRMTGIPVTKVGESEVSRLMKMEDRLRRRIIGQDEAIAKVTGAIRRNRAGIKDPSKPIGTFLFFGPTGVGKTQLAKSIAEYLFDSEENMIRIDMSEYMEKFNVSRLVGAPPGYVGYEEGGQLSERVRRKPYCVVLLDEIEKAHPDVFNLLLQVLDEGRLTDSMGRTVSFRNTVVIMTSNVGSRELEEYGSGMGFMTSSKNAVNGRKGVIEKAVRKVFPPEFINRVDEQIYFNSLDRDCIGKIIDIELRGLKARIKDAGYVLEMSPSARRCVADAGFDPVYGARPLKRAIQKYVENPVSEFIINSHLLSSHAGHDVNTQVPIVLRLGMNKAKDCTKLDVKA